MNKKFDKFDAGWYVWIAVISFVFALILKVKLPDLHWVAFWSLIIIGIIAIILAHNMLKQT